MENINTFLTKDLFVFIGFDLRMNKNDKYIKFDERKVDYS